MRDIGKNIRAIRTAKGMTQDELAAALFVTRQTVSNYENARSRPDLDTMLKIADILGADINAIIYGPPVPQSRKQAYGRAILSFVLLLVLGGLYFGVCALFPTGKLYYGYIFSARILNQVAVLPAMMLVLGWTLLQLLSLFCKVQPPRSKWMKAGRIVVCILLGALAVIPLPYIIWLIVGLIRSLTAHSVSMVFPDIPVYKVVFMIVYNIIHRAPFVYAILGSIAYIFGIPCCSGNGGNG